MNTRNSLCLLICSLAGLLIVCSLLLMPADTIRAQVGSSPRIVASYQHENIGFEGFEPNTNLDLEIFSSPGGDLMHAASLTTDSAGNSSWMEYLTSRLDSISSPATASRPRTCSGQSSAMMLSTLLPTSRRDGEYAWEKWWNRDELYAWRSLTEIYETRGTTLIDIIAGRSGDYRHSAYGNMARIYSLAHTLWSPIRHPTRPEN